MFELRHILSDEEAVTLRDDLIAQYPLDVVELDPDPEPELPVPPGPSPSSRDLMSTSFGAVWGTALSTGKMFRKRNVANRNIAGTSMRIVIPVLDKVYTLKITDIEHTGTPRVMRYGVLSDRRDFKPPFHSEKTWGQGGNVSIELGPSDSGRVIYFNHRIKIEDKRFEPWWSTLSARFLS